MKVVGQTWEKNYIKNLLGGGFCLAHPKQNQRKKKKGGEKKKNHQHDPAKGESNR